MGSAQMHQRDGHASSRLTASSARSLNARSRRRKRGVSMRALDTVSARNARSRAAAREGVSATTSPQSRGRAPCLSRAGAALESARRTGVRALAMTFARCSAHEAGGRRLRARGTCRRTTRLPARGSRASGLDNGRRPFAEPLPMASRAPRGTPRATRDAGPHHRRAPASRAEPSRFGQLTRQAFRLPDTSHLSRRHFSTASKAEPCRCPARARRLASRPRAGGSSAVCCGLEEPARGGLSGLHRSGACAVPVGAHPSGMRFVRAPS